MLPTKQPGCKNRPCMTLQACLAALAQQRVRLTLHAGQHEGMQLPASGRQILAEPAHSASCQPAAQVQAGCHEPLVHAAEIRWVQPFPLRPALLLASRLRQPCLSLCRAPRMTRQGRAGSYCQLGKTWLLTPLGCLDKGERPAAGLNRANCYNGVVQSLVWACILSRWPAGLFV